MKIRIILLIFFLLITFTRNNDLDISVVKIPKQEPKENYDNLYNETIEYIKNHEGFVDTVYNCAAGKHTIGYGHLLTEKDSTLTRINKSQATSLLKKDFNKAINFVKLMTDLKDSKLLSMGHFVFCLGSGNFMKGPYKQIKNGEIPTIILKFCNYKKDSIVYKSENLFKQREWELRMYKK